MSDKVEQPPTDDTRWLAAAEKHILGVLRARYGDVRLDHTESDLGLAQKLVDDGAVSATQALELQCLGVVLGNVFVAQTTMKWAIVTNNYGTLLAIHDHGIGFTLYPLSMISKRIEDGRSVNIPLLYSGFVADLNLTRR